MPITSRGSYTTGPIVSDGSYAWGHNTSSGAWRLSGSFAETGIPKMGLSLDGYRYEYYTTGADASGSAYGADVWTSQTFTPSVGHNVRAVKLKMCRTGTPGTVTVELYATFGGAPTTSLSCSGSTNGDTLTTDWSGEWRAFNMTSIYTLSSGTKYALVVKAASGDVANYVRWCIDGVASYSGGGYVQTNNGGGIWTQFVNSDAMFEVYGTPITGTARVFSGTRDTLSKIGVKLFGYRGQIYNMAVTILQGVKVAMSRVTTTTRDGIPLLGIKPVFSHPLTATRDTLMKAGVKLSTSRLPALIRDSLSKIGVKATADRATTVTRDGIPLLGIKPVFDRGITTTRSALSKVGVKPVFDRALTLARDMLTKVGVKTITERSLGIARDALTKTGVKMITDRAIALVRDAISKVGVKATAGRVVVIVRDTIPKIGVKPVFDRALTMTRDTIIKVGMYLDSLEIPYQVATMALHARDMTTKLHARALSVGLHARSIITKLRTKD